MAQYRRQRKAPLKRPESIRDSVTRGQALRYWLERQHITVTDFAEAVGVSRSTINNYLNGLVDIGLLPQQKAAKLITAMGVSDWDSWDILGIPEDDRLSFRTFRPFPIGHGRPVSEIEEICLSEPLIGAVSLPAGTTITIDPSALDKAIQVIEIEDGRMYSVRTEDLRFSADMLRYVGGLLTAHF